MKNTLLLIALFLSYKVKGDSTKLNCKSILVEVDKFDSTYTAKTPRNLNVMITKYYKPNSGIDTIYYMRLRVSSASAFYDASGIYLLFHDGSKIELKSEKIDIEYIGDGQYMYWAYFTISEDLLLKLQTTYLTDFRLYIIDYSLGNNEMIKLKNNINCLIRNF